MTGKLVITRPDDMHLHVRDGAELREVLVYTARRFERAIIMPNLKPPVTMTEVALAYRGAHPQGIARWQRIHAAHDACI